jgi:hypothetical protein
LSSSALVDVLNQGEVLQFVGEEHAQRLGKNKNIIPFIFYIASELTREDESLVLQAFQFNRLAYLLKDYQDQIVNALTNRKP